MLKDDGIKAGLIEPTDDDIARMKLDTEFVKRAFPGRKTKADHEAQPVVQEATPETPQADAAAEEKLDEKATRKTKR